MSARSISLLFVLARLFDLEFIALLDLDMRISLR